MRVDRASGRVVWSASDLKVAAECEFAWLRALDAKLGRIDAVEEPEDAMLRRAIELGDAHELAVLGRYREEFGERVVAIPQVSARDADALAEAVARTNEALASDAAVIFQGAFASDDFVGFADFIIRDDAGLWRVQDTKLARAARTTALMQLAAYVDQLDQLSVARSASVDLLLGDGSTSTHEVRDLLPLFFVRRDRLRALIDDRAPGAAVEPIPWGDERGDLAVFACGRCATCELEVVAHRDLLLVAGMRPSQRERLRGAGIMTIDDLEVAEDAPQGMNAEVFRSLRKQAEMQLKSEQSATDGATPAYEVVQPAALGTMPRPSNGDIFFDFEGDPLYAESLGVDSGQFSDQTMWGIDYLFGWVDLDEQYTALWAHTIADERAAFERFLDFVQVRKRAHPEMHIYHYAPYEPTHLASMAERHGIREAEVDQLLRAETFVDLYPVVRRALRVGSRSYSIKKLEPLYMGDEVRLQAVQQGGDSIVRYHEARVLLERGDEAAAQVILDDLADYNRYDCVSTRRLRDWLVDRARETGVVPAMSEREEETAREPSQRSVQLLDRAAEARDSAASTEVAPATALRLAAAATEYYPREGKSFWRAHFQRLREPMSLWDDTRDVLVIDEEHSEVITDWSTPPKARRLQRALLLRGELAPGSRFSVNSDVRLLYATPAPFPTAASARWLYSDRTATITEAVDGGIVVTEGAVGGETWQELPAAVAPGPPPHPGKQQEAIDAWADQVLSATVIDAAALPDDPASDLLLRRAPRGGIVRSGDDVSSIVATLLALDRSYIAVQGPPGTGKTYVGSHVIAELVNDHGFRVGVVAQSHAVVENMLDRVVAAGVPAERVGKALKSGASDDNVRFTVIRKAAAAAFVEEQPDGFVLGGTAWDFANPQRVAPASLDLLVIDEAGQFSLASTIAVSVAAKRLLLLGDPQQLPQVSQGVHPAPVDASALSWVMGDHAVLPAERGFFLAHSWRMHPEVAEAVSHLAYEGKLAAHDGTALRSIEGIGAGVHPVPRRHSGNATESHEEAETVVEIVRDLIGRAFTDIEIDADGRAQVRAPSPLGEDDIIVVTPYNAQQQLVEHALTTAGFGRVRVGTVDKFQGQEAAVSIVSLAASSGRMAPRGTEFLLLQNRLNVAVSRAKVAAFVISSPALLDDLPWRPDGVARMSAFARLVGAVNPKGPRDAKSPV